MRRLMDGSWGVACMPFGLGRRVNAVWARGGYAAVYGRIDAAPA